MTNFKLPGYPVYSLILIFVAAIFLTSVFGVRATHQGGVLGLVSIITGLLLLYRAQHSRKVMAIAILVIFCIAEMLSGVVIKVGNDPTELWLASFYAVVAILMIAESIIIGLYRRQALKDEQL